MKFTPMKWHTLSRTSYAISSFYFSGHALFLPEIQHTQLLRRLCGLWASFCHIMTNAIIWSYGQHTLAPSSARQNACPQYFLCANTHQRHEKRLAVPLHFTPAFYFQHVFFPESIAVLLSLSILGSSAAFVIVSEYTDYQHHFVFQIMSMTIVIGSTSWQLCCGFFLLAVGK